MARKLGVVSGAVACAALLLFAGSCTDPGHGDRVDRGELASVLAQGFAEGYHSATATDVPNPERGMAQRSVAVEEFMRRRGFSEVEKKRALERIEALGSEEPPSSPWVQDGAAWVADRQGYWVGQERIAYVFGAAVGFRAGYGSATSTETPSADHALSQQFGMVEQMVSQFGFSDAQRAELRERIATFHDQANARSREQTGK